MRRLPLLPRLASRGYRRRPTAIARSCVPRHCEVGTRHLGSDLRAADSDTLPSRPARRLPTLPPCGAVLAVCDPPRLLHSDLRSAGVRPRGRLAGRRRAASDARTRASGRGPAGRHSKQDGPPCWIRRSACAAMPGGTRSRGAERAGGPRQDAGTPTEPALVAPRRGVARRPRAATEGKTASRLLQDGRAPSMIKPTGFVGNLRRA
jgi:hypothetical protein